VQVTTSNSGRKIFNLTVKRKDFISLLSSAIKYNGSYEWWLPTKDEEVIKLIVEDSK
jgi:hypothetical protein